MSLFLNLGGSKRLGEEFLGFFGFSGVFDHRVRLADRAEHGGGWVTIDGNLENDGGPLKGKL